MVDTCGRQRSTHTLCWLTFAVLLSLTACCCYASRRSEWHWLRPSTRFPPSFTTQPRRQLAYKLGDLVVLECHADAYPPAQYSWLKNGRELDVDGAAGISQRPGTGTITIEIDELQSHHDGEYQCVASNPHGKAVSIKAVLKRATLDPFPTVVDPQIYRPTVGSSLTLKCDPPPSYPPGSVYWGETKNGPKVRPIENTDRVSLDYEGNLHFANIVAADDLGDTQPYVCVLSNELLRSLVQGEDQRIVPQWLTARPSHAPPRIMWSSPTADVAVKSQTKKMKCIFSGYPTPRVSWRRLDAPMPRKTYNSSFGQELVIPDVDFSDKGKYQCVATNSRSMPEVRRDFTLIVESTPFWRDGRPPDDVNASEDEDAEFKCNVNGFPRPTITWMINGRPIDANEYPRAAFASKGSRLIFREVTENDVLVVQCNASNTHGYIFANAFLNVLAEPAVVERGPEPVLKVAVGRVAVLTCRVFGAPRPEIIWQKGELFEDVQDFHDPRITVLNNGDLEIQNVNYADNDTYQCYTTNKLGSDSASGLLSVIERTVIVDRPQPRVISAPSDVTVTCRATTDASEAHNLRIQWRRNGDVINPAPGSRYVISDDGGQLTIRQSRVTDTATYTCRAENGVDFDTVEVPVTVRDRPEKPHDAQLSACEQTFAVVTWSPGDDNNAPITGFIISYVTSHDAEATNSNGPHVGARVGASDVSARVKLAPWTQYWFSVAAENDVGVSDRTEVVAATESVAHPCITEGGPPGRSPNRVCTNSQRPDQLVIIWEPMLPAEHHGDGFRYVVTYRRRASMASPTQTVVIRDWRQSAYVVSGQLMYDEYDISVLARNDIGDAPAPTTMIGYSGEDVPLEVADSFTVVNSSVNATSAVFTWHKVNTSFDSIRGFFRGYQIRFWRTSHPRDVRKENITLHEWSPCREPEESVRLRYRRSDEQLFTGSTSKLWPFSEITAGVIVLNGAKEGDISNTVTFDTPQGVPGPVSSPAVNELGSHHVKLTWNKPQQLNGIPRGYIIGYREVVPDGNGALMETVVDDPDQTYKKIHRLEPNTTYAMTIVALTDAGRGPEVTVNAFTVPVSDIDKPKIDDIDVREDYVVVSWKPSADRPSNPASEFVVEYRPEGSDEWERSDAETEHSQVNVSGLVHGQAYELRVVALGHHGNPDVKSDVEEITVGLPHAAPVKQGVKSSLLFIIILCILTLLFFILLIVFLIRYNRGDKYKVYEKEKRHGAKGGRLDEEDQFCEYVRSEDPVKKKSQGSLESSSRSDDDEGSDSLGVYEEDPTKFNDEGSFIDQSGYKHVLEASTPDGNAVPPTAI